MAGIETYVFLDLETTSIPSLEHNKTKICEISMVALKRRHILDTIPGALPRVQHKLTMCFNPGRMIDPEATKASGLDNDLLEHEILFNQDVFSTIKSFLMSQKEPVCLIAENGYDFDFPILKNHFEKLKVCLSENIKCADSLYAFYDILKKSEQKNQSNNESSSGEEPKKIMEVKTDANVHVIDDNIKKKPLLSTLNDDTVDSFENNNEDIELHSPTSMQKLNETTPKSYKPKMRSVKKNSSARRKIFYEGDKKPDQSYRLKNIYKRVLGRSEIEAHRAENDCLMAAEIATAMAEEFVDWVDNNHSAFAEVKAMIPGVRIGH